MPELTKLDIEDIFSYHAAEADQIPSYNAIREGAKQFALLILEHTSPCADQIAAIRKLRESAYHANAAVALKGKY